jgi:hypothetical protein
MPAPTRRWTALTHTALLALLVPAAFLALPVRAASADVLSVTFTTPDPGEVVSDTDQPVGINFSIDSNRGTANVSYSVDSDPPFTSDTAPWVAGAGTDGITWDTTKLANGPHVLHAKVDDGAGHSATAQESVTVQNVPAPDPFAISVTSPTSGSTVKGATDIVATTGNGQNATNVLTSVSFAVDGTALGTDTSGAGTHGGSSTVKWNTIGVANGTHTLTATAVDSDGATVTSSGVPVTVANQVCTNCTVAITSPLNGDVVKTVVQVQATASETGDTAAPASLTYFVDGRQLPDLPAPHQPTFAPTGQSATGSTWWDTSGLSGQHTLTAAAVDSAGSVARSTPITVTVNNPPPTVTVQSPAAGQVAPGSVPFAALLHTDANLSSLPFLVSYIVDGHSIGLHKLNAQGQHDVTDSIAWDTSHLAGVHHLLVGMMDTTGAIAFSAPFDVSVFSRTHLVGKAVTVKGQHLVYRVTLTSVNDGNGLPGQQVRLALTDALRHNGSRTLVTGVGGVAQFPLTVLSNAKLTFTYAGLPASGYAPVRLAQNLPISAPAVCRLAHTTIARGTQTAGACTVPRLPKGVRAAVMYRVRGKWVAIAGAKSGPGGVRFAVGFTKPGRYVLQLVLNANPVYARTFVPLRTLLVR